MRNLVLALGLIIGGEAYGCMNVINDANLTKALALDNSADPGCSPTELCYCYDGTKGWETAGIATQIGRASCRERV